MAAAISIGPLREARHAPEGPGFSFWSVRPKRRTLLMDYDRWGWLLIALGLIGLGVTVAMVAKMPA